MPIGWDYRMINWQTLEVGEHRLVCHVCGDSRKKNLGVTINADGTGRAHCFKCGYVETHRAERTPTYRPAKAISRPVVPLKRETLSEYGLELWSACTGLRGTIGEQYLLARGCVIPPDDGDLRFHPALKNPASDYTGPALVALVSHVVTRVPMTLHRTWIRADGTKADCNPPRMLLGGHRKGGGVIRLWPDEAVTLGLGIAEGIETALSLAHAFTPVWACIDAGNLAAMPVLDGVESLLIAADNDHVGITAAETCSSRWIAAESEVHIAIPPDRKTDFNDVARAA